MHVQHEEFKEIHVSSDGTVKLKGQEIAYRVVSEDYVIEIDGKLAGTVFTYSYFRTNCDNKEARPIIFAWNGGPCASCLWLHMGFLGPFRAIFQETQFTSPVAPFESEPNPHWLLDDYDIVLMEPIGSGYGRLLAPEMSDHIFGVDEDAAIFTEVIHEWLEKYARFGSPKYLLGESYGTIRAAVVADQISGGLMGNSKKYYGINFDGVILMGSAIGTGNGLLEFPATERSVLDFPTMAALNHYHYRNDKPPLIDFVEQAQEFAESEYLLCLQQGNRIDSSRRQSLIEKLTYFTGLPEDYIAGKPFLRLTIEDSKKHLLPGMWIDSNEGRFTMPVQTVASDPMRDNSAMAGFVPALVGLMQTRGKKELGIAESRRYQTVYLGEDGNSPVEYKELSWRSAIDCLTAVMRRNAKFRVMFASGWYDPATIASGVRYLLAHSNLPSERVTVKEYTAGHMIYINERSAAQLEQDIRTFIG